MTGREREVKETETHREFETGVGGGDEAQEGKIGETGWWVGREGGRERVNGLVESNTRAREGERGV